MSEELVGALMDEGYSPQEVREMMGPMLAERDNESESDHREMGHDPMGRAELLQHILTQARDDRQAPGPTAVVPSGVIRSLPNARHAKPVRVDTEESYRAFRSSGNEDLPEDNIEALSTAAQDELMGFGERGYASQIIGNIMDMVPASQIPFQSLSPHQTCIVCGADGGVVCPECGSRLPEIIGLFDRGYASQNIVPVGFGERGSAAAMYDDDMPSATIEGDDDFYRLERMIGASDDEFYRLDRMRGGESPLVGGDDFYRLDRHEGYSSGLSALIGDVLALSVPSTVYAEEIPLSFKRADQVKHTTAWKQGAHIYGSIRVTGWDGQPRILTTATPYAREVGIVVGYSSSASIPPSHTLAIIDPLARQLGASRLFPRLAAASPAVLRVAHEKSAPILLTAMPAGGNTDGWV